MMRFRVEVRVIDVVTRKDRWAFVKPTRGEPYEMLTLDAAYEFVRRWYRDADTRIVAVRFASVDGRDGFKRVFCTAGVGCCTQVVELSRRECAGVYWYKIPRLGYWLSGGKS